MAKQASTQWADLRRVIDGASAAQAQIMCNVLNIPHAFSAHNLDGTKQAIRKEAYEAAKRKSGGNYEATLKAYDATRELLRDAAGMGASDNGASSQSSSASASNAGTFGNRSREASDGMGEMQAALTGADKEALTTAAEAAKILASVTTLAEQLTRKVEQFGAVTSAEVQALVTAAVSNIPARVFEVRREGELIGKVEGRQHKQFATLLKAATARQCDGYMPNIWLAGPAGSGKTTAARNVAKALGLGFHFNGALSMAHEVLGFVDAGGTYHATAFRKAFESGAAYLFDEIDGCTDNSPLLALNAALANGVATFPDAQVKRHENSLIIAGANTFGLGASADYVGRIKLDGAVRDRFPVTIFWDYDEELEAFICGNAAWAQNVQAARRRARTAGLKVLITPRASIAGAALIAAGHSFEEAAALTYLAPLSADQKRQIGA